MPKEKLKMKCLCEIIGEFAETWTKYQSSWEWNPEKLESMENAPSNPDQTNTQTTE